MSVDALVWRSASRHTITHTILQETTCVCVCCGGFLSLWIFCVFMCVYSPDCWPKELAGLWCCLQQLVSKGRGAVWTVQSAPHKQAKVSTHDTRRQRMSHFTHSWKEWCISLCHLELLLSAGVWCVEGKGTGRYRGLVWGLPLPRLKSLLGQGLSYLQKREENSRDGSDWHTVLLAQ